MRCDRFCASASPFLVGVVATNINPVPAIAGGNPRPAGIIRIVIKVWAAKAEREEAVVKSVVEAVMKVVATPRKVIGTHSHALNAWAGHVAHRDAMHSGGAAPTADVSTTAPTAAARCVNYISHLKAAN